MARMVRKQVYIQDEQDRLLKARAAALGVTESELIRRGIDGVLGRQLPTTDPDAWEAALTFMRERTSGSAPRAPRTWTRDDAYDDD